MINFFMPYWRLYYHIIWSTKDRQPLIHPSFENRLFQFLKKKALSLGCSVEAVNGCEDHIHLVISIPPKLSIAEVVHSLKGASSHDFSEVSWQRGYGVFSFGERQRIYAVEYVNRQKEHHAQQTTNKWLEHCEDDE